MIRSLAAALFLTTGLSTAIVSPLFAQEAIRSKPTALPVNDATPAPKDVPYPGGTIKLEVDASDTTQRIFRVKETIPVAASGPMTLLMPAWLPGNHAPRGQIEKLTGLTITANGQPVAWKRDPLNVFGFVIDVPQGAREVVAQFQFLSATQPNQGRVVITPKM
ncbi:MAG: peptidase M61, partial [Alphaproteobacteria bacterium]